MWDRYFLVSSFDEVIVLLEKYSQTAKIVAGGTDLMLEIERGMHPENLVIIDISRCKENDKIYEDADGKIHIGALVTHNQAAESHLIQKKATCLALACYHVGSPQIRNRGTIAGNIVTASPANDTITALNSLGAEVLLTSTKSDRRISIEDFYQGVRKCSIEKNEVLKEIVLPKTNANFHSTFQKLGLRKAQAISVVNVSLSATLENGRILNSRIAAGSVSPTIKRLNQVEIYFSGKMISDIPILDFSDMLPEISPITDLRGSNQYRREMISTLINRCILDLRSDKSKDNIIPPNPITLDSKESSNNPKFVDVSVEIDKDNPIITEINGKTYEFRGASQKSLLDLVREDAGLVGSKEGCGEGECGACTMFLDGKAVMACLVPAPRAHLAKVVTIEGISPSTGLHPIQQAFIDEGAVQCGYCTPGFVMSAVKLLEEKEKPDREDIKVAISGNLCRCTGYYKIVDAIDKVVQDLEG